MNHNRGNMFPHANSSLDSTLVKVDKIEIIWGNTYGDTQLLPHHDEHHIEFDFWSLLATLRFMMGDANAYQALEEFIDGLKGMAADEI